MASKSTTVLLCTRRLSGTLVFALMFWVYGVVPNQWLQWANNELGWTPTKKLWTADQYELIGVPLPPFEVNFEKIRDIIVVLIYAFFLGAQITVWLPISAAKPCMAV